MEALVSAPGGSARTFKAIATLILLLPWTALADPEREVREAVTALAGTSYAWKTTARQKFSGDSAEPKLNPSAPIETEGRTDPNGYTEITQLTSREVAGPVHAVFRQGEVVGQTPMGWLRRSALRQVPGPDRTIEFGGKQVRLSRVLGAVLKVTAQRNPTEELFDLLADIKSYRGEGGLVIGELRDRVVEQLWGDAQAKRAPEIQGTVIFKMSPQGLTEYHLVLGIGFPNSRTKAVAWSTVQWSTRISGIGSTTVNPPAAAVKALEE